MVPKKEREKYIFVLREGPFLNFPETLIHSKVHKRSLKLYFNSNISFSTSNLVTNF